MGTEPFRTGDLSRRNMLASGVGLATAMLGGGAAEARAASHAPAVLDTHIHLFDPSRPQGAPYRGPRGTIFNTKGASAASYAELMRPDGVVGAIAVEASGWQEDNLWLLEAAALNPIMVGVIGNLRPEAPDFAETLERFAKNPLYRGIRYGNLWGYDIVARSTERPFLDGLKRVAAADLVMDTANPTVGLLQALVRVNDAVPDLRIIIDHLPKLDPTPAEQGDYEGVLRELGARPNLSVKLSAVIHPRNGSVSMDLGAHRERLDQLFATFGEDRVMFGSDWPNVEGDAPAARELALVRQYFASKPLKQQEKYFSGNSRRIYRWSPRTSTQRALP